jgi:hypothetical protein
VERLDHFSAEDGCWEEIVVEDRRATPADVAACRIDFAEWLRRLTARLRKIALALAAGETTTAAARMFGVTPARISQIRDLLRRSWQAFQGTPEIAEASQPVAAWGETWCRPPRFRPWRAFTTTRPGSGENVAVIIFALKAANLAKCCDIPRLELTGGNGGPGESDVGVAMTEYSDEELERITIAGQTIDEPLALASATSAAGDRHLRLAGPDGDEA